MKRLLLFILPLMAACTTTSYSQELEFHTVAKGPASGIQKRQQVVIQSPSEWVSFWAAHVSNHDPSPKLPDVDFQKKSVIGIFMGQQKTGGYAVKIARVAETAKEIRVFFQETRPAQGAIVTMAMTSPYHLVAIPKTTKKVVFKKLDR